MSTLKNEETTLPLLFRTGINYFLPWELMQNKPLLAADIIYVFNDEASVNLGVEAAMLEYLDLRLGYILGRDSQNITGGLGISYGIFDFDYAFVPFSYDLGNSHRISVNIDF
jgi:hypothetical protein